jgi:hypothetical protein
MTKLECALADSLIQPVPDQPFLSIVIPTHNRPDELALTVQCIADQLTDGLENRVEILISDNASGPETVDLIRTLAAKYPTVSYMLNARDENGLFNLFSAPWRARGKFTWTFGSDDILLEGGVASVVALLEQEQPSFMTLNKQAANADLTQVIWTSMNSVQARRFDDFIELFSALGVNQLAFISAQIEDTEAARAIDVEPYLRTDSRHPHIAAYLEKHAGKPALYSADTHLVHRLDNSTMLAYHAGNFYDYGVTLPALLLEVMEKVGAPADLFERITGAKRIDDYDAPAITFVDSMFENMLRAIAFGLYIPGGHWRTLDQALSKNVRADRPAQFAQIWAYSQKVAQLEKAETAAKMALELAKQKALETSKLFTTSTQDQ